MHRVPDHVRSNHSMDGATVLDVRHGQIYSLNYAGSRMLELIKDGFQDSDIVDMISSQFSIPSQVAKQDLEDFLRMLKNHNLLQ